MVARLTPYLSKVRSSCIIGHSTDTTMNTTLSQRQLQDITILRDPEWTRRPWAVELGEHLEGFLEAIDILSSVNTTVNVDGQNLGLSDAAYVLNNVGFVWSRQVDETARLAQQTAEVLDNMEARKQKSKDTDEANKLITKRPTVHPLVFPADDTKKVASTVLPLIEASKIPLHKNLLCDIPQLSSDAYLAPNEPRTLQLMDCEKIRTYFDDRGNKGHDWAEYQINVIRLSKEGYYPLEHGGSYKTDDGGKRRYTFSIMPEIVDDNHTLTDGENANSFDNGDRTAIQVAADQLAEKIDVMSLMDEKNMPPSDRIRRTRQTSDTKTLQTVGFEEFRTVSAATQQKKLTNVVTPPDVDNPETPYKRRCKRKVIPKDIEIYGMEVEFFKHFWNVETGHVNLKFVLERFNQRLHELEVPQKKGRGKKPATAIKKVQFVSMTPAESLSEGAGNAAQAEPMSVGFDEILVDGGFPGRADSEVGLETIIDQAADYLDTDEPCGDETLIKLTTRNNDLCGAFHRLNFTQVNHHNHHDTLYFQDLDKSDLVADISMLPECDLHDWECRLEQFLVEHEPATAKFSLKDCGQNIVKSFHADKDVGMVDVIGMKRTSGEVSQAFLSVLDLVNKDVVILDVEKSSKSGAAKEMALDSQDASKCGLRVVGKV